MQYVRGFSFLYRVSLLVQVSANDFWKAYMYTDITAFGIKLTQSVE